MEAEHHNSAVLDMLPAEGNLPVGEEDDHSLVVVRIPVAAGRKLAVAVAVDRMLAVADPVHILVVVDPVRIVAVEEAGRILAVEELDRILVVEELDRILGSEGDTHLAAGRTHLGYHIGLEGDLLEAENLAHLECRTTSRWHQA